MAIRKDLSDVKSHDGYTNTAYIKPFQGERKSSTEDKVSNSLIDNHDKSDVTRNGKEADSQFSKIPAAKNANEVKTQSSMAKSFIIKYFLEGQNLKVGIASKSDPNLPFFRRILSNRRFWGIIIPLIFFEVCWWLLAVKHDFFRYFSDKYIMSITMIFGAMVAGMTSEGGGAVAFPVMTLALHIRPAVARDFSLMIQSCGMSAAAFTIFWMKLKVEKHSLLFCSLGNQYTKLL